MKKFNLIIGASIGIVVLLVLIIITNKVNYDNIALQAQEPLNLSVEEKVQVVLQTSKGDIHMDVYPKLVPETAQNFLFLAKENKYDGVIFHRVIKDFMIQTGDFENFNGTGGHSYKGEGTTIDEEFNPKLRHVYGAVSMAKTNMPSSTGSQFFIVQSKTGTPHLDDLHSVFGMVTKGMDVVEKIANSKKDQLDRPLYDIEIEDVIIK
jgi:peptidyl-prolyl cis-trans isomerase B (cyclophilin B)